MSLKYERLIPFGPVVDYRRQKTWTPEVRELYERLQGLDCTALAPLIEIDLEFLGDPAAIEALVILKYSTNYYPPAKLRYELRKVTNVIGRRPAPHRGKLIWGDGLLAYQGILGGWIEKHRLLEVVRNRGALEKRIDEALDQPGSPASEHDRARVRQALLDGARSGTGYVRTARRWARGFQAAWYGVDPKAIDKRIARDPIVKLKRAKEKKAPT